jgi:propionyl-CoA carboxylase alpha chain
MTLVEALPKVLVANRGEIAVRIIRTLRRLGIASVAVYHPLDRQAPYVGMADEAVELRGEPPVRAYLDIEQLVQACLATGAVAAHPGYGFLSENPDFPRALAAAGLGWIGPHAEAIAAMGDKIASKKLAVAAGVAVAPGGLDAVEDAADARAVAREIGFPVMLKASAGGGGKGLRVVRDEAGLAPAFDTARSEAIAAFGDGRIFVEKFVERPRHVEIQIVGDKHGAVLHLGERECSIQRRNQKIIEEAPSPFISAGTRAEMGRQAVALARSVGYDSLGTMEFIVGPDQSFYFIEMNTRLQVEHPVTELVTGLDLVELQLRAAAGEALPIGQEDVRMNGAAIELRICAEDPDRNFLPSTGPIARLDVPNSALARFDSGVAEGSIVSAAFDPMLAKLVVHGADRTQAIARAREAAAELCVLGLTTNLPYLRRVLRHPAFAAGETHTGFLDQHADELARFAPDEGMLRAVAATAALRDPGFTRNVRQTPEPLGAIGAWSNV